MSPAFTKLLDLASFQFNLHRHSLSDVLLQPFYCCNQQQKQVLHLVSLMQGGMGVSAAYICKILPTSETGYTYAAPLLARQHDGYEIPPQSNQCLSG